MIESTKGCGCKITFSEATLRIADAAVVAEIDAVALPVPEVIYKPGPVSVTVEFVQTEAERLLTEQAVDELFGEPSPVVRLPAQRVGEILGLNPHRTSPP